MEEKWKVLIEACKSYYIDSLPTGMSDSEYDALEEQALREDGFSVRDYVLDKYLKGTRAMNHEIEKIKKTKVQGMSMLDALSNSGADYYNLKYDGSSIACYITDGTPRRVVTVGNLNINNFGIDQTWKLLKFMPPRFPKGIIAVQMEALVDISRLPTEISPERARQKANGLVNSKLCQSEVDQLLTLRVYRYYTDSSEEGLELRKRDYREVLQSFGVVTSEEDGHIMFAPADVYTIDELRQKPGYCESDCSETSTGVFLNDGWVTYSKEGVCQGAFKYAGAGSETDGKIVTTVKNIQWNNQVPKGKDSWSANVIIDPVVIKGTKISKPGAGSVGKLVKNLITPGAKVGIILANSTIPMVGDVFEPGNGDFCWPTCGCGHEMSEADVYGSNLKCGNPLCIERLERMRKYLKTNQKIGLNEFLVIDRFKWEATDINIDKLLEYVAQNDKNGYHNYLDSYMKTELQKRNLELVWEASFITLRENYELYNEQK